MRLGDATQSNVPRVSFNKIKFKTVLYSGIFLSKLVELLLLDRLFQFILYFWSFQYLYEIVDLTQFC